MRAPDNKQQPFVGYTDAQWDAIRESLGGIDLDTTMVNVKWPFDDLGVRSLRGLLQKLAWHSGETSPLGKALTPKQLAAKWQKELTKLRSAIDAVATFKFYDAGDGGHNCRVAATHRHVDDDGQPQQRQRAQAAHQILEGADAGVPEGHGQRRAKTTPTSS
jgi:hypothetical protein